jgi:hypothetical protein
MHKSPFQYELNDLHQQELLQQAARLTQAKAAARMPYNPRFHRTVLVRMGELLTQWGNELQVRYGDLNEMELAQAEMPGFTPKTDCC